MSRFSVRFQWREYIFRSIESALSNDGGLTFVKEPGVRINRGWHDDIDPDNVGAPTTVLLPDGRFRMYYRAGDEDDRWMNGLKSVILSAISDDGLLFTPEEGVRVSPEDWIDPTAPEDISYLDGPDAIMTGDGGVKLYFLGRPSLHRRLLGRVERRPHL